MMILQHALKNYAIVRRIFEPRHALGGPRSVVAVAGDRCLNVQYLVTLPVEIDRSWTGSSHSLGHAMDILEPGAVFPTGMVQYSASTCRTWSFCCVVCDLLGLARRRLLSSRSFTPTVNN
jgi:hypothetical protein